jgi:hypothetical protein
MARLNSEHLFGSLWLLVAGMDFACLVGAVSDTAFIVFFRRMPRRVAALSGFWSVIFHLFIIVMVVALLTAPFVIAAWWKDLMPDAETNVGAVAYLTATWSGTNLIDVLCLLLLLFIMFFLLAHRIVWPLLKRPLYAANRKGLIKNTKLLGALGTMLIMYAFPNNPIVKWLTDFLPKMKG